MEPFLTLVKVIRGQTYLFSDTKMHRCISPSLVLGLRKMVHHWNQQNLEFEKNLPWFSDGYLLQSIKTLTGLNMKHAIFFPMGKTCNKIKMSVNFAMKNEIQILSSKQKRIVHITIRHSVETGSFQFSSQIMFNAWALNLTSIVLLSCTWCLLTIVLGNKLTHSHLKFVLK